MAMKRTGTGKAKDAKKKRNPYAGTPLEHWSQEDFDDLWCTLFHQSVRGITTNKNRACIVKHYCNIAEKKKADFMFRHGKRKGTETK